jgi:hypothetical protein
MENKYGRFLLPLKNCLQRACKVFLEVINSTSMSTGPSFALSEKTLALMGPSKKIEENVRKELDQ